MADNTSFDNNDLNESRDIFREISDALRSSTNELKTQRTLNSEITRDFSNYQKLVSKVLQDAEGITNLSDKDLSKLIEKQKVLLNELKKKAENLDLTRKLSEEEQALRQAAEEGFALQVEALETTEEYLTQRLEINKALGISGTLLKASRDVLDKMNLSTLNHVINFEKANQKMTQHAERIRESGGELNTFSTKLRVGFTGVGSVLKDVVKHLKDPLVIIGAMTSGFLKLNQASTEYTRSTGLSENNVKESLFSLTTSVDQFKALADLSNEFGINAGLAFNEKQTQDLALITTRLGLSANQAGRIASFANQSNQSIETTTDNIFKQTGQFAAQNRLNINGRKLLDDIANTSAATSISLGNNVQKITQANLEAKKLGLSLQQVEGIADSLLDFQSSIANELEAELLTGQQLNLEQARYYALTNDLAGLSKEIGKNQEVISAFASGNRIQQESIAKSLGMQREDVAKMIYQQQIQSGLTSQQAAAQAGMTLDQATQLSAQESISKLMEKITILAGTLAGYVLTIFDHWYLLYPVLGLVGLVAIPKMVNGMKSFYGTVKDSISSFKTLFGLINKNKASEAVEDIGSSIAEQAQEKVGDVTSSGKGSKGLSSLGESFSNIGKNFVDIAKGAGAVTLMGLSSLMLIPAIPGLLSTLITGPAASFGLPLLGNAFSELGKQLPSITQGALALGLIGLATIPFAYSMSLLKDIDPASILAFGASITGLSIAMALLGPLLPAIGMGAIALGVLSLGLLAFGGSLSLVSSNSKQIEQFVESLKGLASMEMITGLMMLGPALLSAAAGLGMFGLALGASTLMSGLSMLVGNPAISILESLANMAPRLQGVGQSLNSIAEGLLRISNSLVQLDTSKLEEIADIAEENVLEGFANKIVSTIAKPLESISSNTQGNKNSELTEIKNLLQEILQKEGNVRIDSTKIGTALGMKTYRIQ